MYFPEKGGREISLTYFAAVPLALMRALNRKASSFKPVISAFDSRVETKLRISLKCLNLDEDVSRYVIYKLNKPIGVISFNKEEIPSIKDLALLKEYKKEKEIIEHFIENNLKYFNSPFYPM